MAKRKAERLKRIGITVVEVHESSGIPGTSESPENSAGLSSDGQLIRGLVSGASLQQPICLLLVEELRQRR